MISGITRDPSLILPTLGCKLCSIGALVANWGIGGKTTSGYGRLGQVAEMPQQPVAQVVSSSQRSVRPKVSPVKRASGTPATVRIVGPRKTGYDVQEEGRPQGTLTVGNKPENVSANDGEHVTVEVHNDDPNRPQYRWPSQRQTKKKPRRK